MYHSFYRLKDEPFRLTPDPAFICMTSQHQEALSGLIYSVCTRPGLAVLVGEAGTGKTTILYSLMGLLEKRQLVTAMCNNPTLTREEFYDLLLVELGVECSSPLKSRQLMALHDTLIRYRAAGRPAVLIVDEAQRLPPALLEEIRLLLNLETPTEKLLQIIMAGQPELGEILRRPELRQLKQRVSCICKLDPLSLLELREYLHHRLTRAGLPEQSLFSEAAIQLIFEYTQGIPRLVNCLCSSALRTGFALQSHTVTIPIIQEAAKDLDLRREEPSRPIVTPFPTSLRIPSPEENRSQAPAAPPLEKAVPLSAATHRNGGGSVAQLRIPLENYTARQKSLGFFSNLMDRWK